jgi:transposase
MYRYIAREIKELIIIGLGDGLSAKEAAKVFCCSDRTVRRVRQNYREYGSVVPPRQAPSGRPRVFDRQAVNYLLEVLAAQPDIFLDELQGMLLATQDRLDGREQVCITTVSTMLKREGITRKRLSRIARERSRRKRLQFWLETAEYRPDQFVFLDETRKDDRTTYRRYGRATHGRRAEADIQFVRGIGYSVLPAMSLDGFLAVDVVEGSWNMEAFERFVLFEVVPQMNPFPEKNSVLVMDNCRIHKSGFMLNILRGLGIRVHFLPPYSPDYNPIEQAFSVYKAWLRRHGANVRTYPGSPIVILVRGLYESVGLEDIAGFFRNCGYHDNV